jgi:hypothetical protein
VVSIGAAGVQVIEQICEFLVAGSPSCRAHHLPRFRKLRRRFAAASLSTVRAHGFRIPLFLERRALRTGPSRLSGKRPNRRVGVAALRPARRVVRNGGIYVLGARARPMTLSLGLGDRWLFLSSRRRRPSDCARVCPRRTGRRCAVARPNSLGEFKLRLGVSHDGDGRGRRRERGPSQR